MDKELWNLSQYRMEQAERCIRSAKVLAEDEDYKGSANRSYYAIFHCMRSILALEGFDRDATLDDPLWGRLVELLRWAKDSILSLRSTYGDNFPLYLETKNDVKNLLSNDHEN